MKPAIPASWRAGISGAPFAALLAAVAYVPSTMGHPWHSLVAGGAAAASGIFLFRRTFWWRPSFWPVPLAILVWAGLGLIFSPDRTLGLHDWSNLATAGLVFLAALQVLPDNSAARRAVLAGLAVVGALRLVETFLFLNMPVDARPPVLWGVPNHNFLAFVWVTGALAAAPFWRPARPVARLAGAALLAGTLWFLITWNLRGGLVAGTVGMTAAVLAAMGKKRWLWAAFAAGAVVLFFTVWAGAPSWLQNNPNDPARLERLVIWGDALRYAAAHPWGTGLGSFETHYRLFQTLAGWRAVQYAHNEYLQIICELGIPAALAVFFLLGVLFLHAWRKAEAQPETFALLAAAAAWSVFDFMWHGDFPLYALAVTAAAVFPTRGGKPGTAWRSGLLVGGALLLGVHLIQGFSLAEHGRGKRALYAGDHAKALAHLTRASGFAPWDAHLFFDQATVLREMGRPEEAEARLRHALRLKPQDVVHRRALAKLRLAAKDVEGARAVYAPNLEWAPAVPQVWKEMADLHRWAGDEAAAARCMERFETLLKRPLAPANVLPKNP